MTADLGTIITEIDMLAEEISVRFNDGVKAIDGSGSARCNSFVAEINSIAEEIAANNDSSVQHSAVAPQATPEVTSISTGLSIVGKIVAQGAVTIFGQVEGELRASTVVIAEGAQMEGDVVADELTIGGHVKGTVHANRVKLNSTAVVEGDIFHRTLAIEENARFEGMSRRNENTINTPSDVQKNRSHAKTVSIEDNPKGNGSSDGANAHTSGAADPGPNFSSLRRLLMR
jgi:cytoskeletal protein CcmA (bactofilin family)